MAEISKEDLRKLQLKSLEMAKYFVEFCKENNLLTYFCGGGCIGAIRHGGFIPWDDDLDFFMPRKDYEKLYRLWKKKADNEAYSILRPKRTMIDHNLFITIRDNNTTQIKPYQKDLDISHGVALDIFPIDGCPSSSFKRKMQLFWGMIYSLFCAQLIPVNHGKKKAMMAKIAFVLVPFKGLRYRIWKFAEKQMSKYELDKCESMTELCAGPGYMKNVYPRKAFDSAIFVDFEDTKMPIPVGYDEYLRIAFGDYMKMPPVEKQVAHHDVEFKDLDNSYLKYKGVYYCKNGEKNG